MSKAKLDEISTTMKLWIGGILGTLVMGLAFGGWQARDYIEERLASKDDVKHVGEVAIVAGVKADFVIDQQMEDLIAKIAYLDRKPNKTTDEREQLKYLRDQLERMRRIRTGK